MIVTKRLKLISTLTALVLSVSGCEAPPKECEPKFRPGDVVFLKADARREHPYIVNAYYKYEYVYNVCRYELLSLTGVVVNSITEPNLTK